MSDSAPWCYLCGLDHDPFECPMFDKHEADLVAPTLIDPAGRCRLCKQRLDGDASRHAASCVHYRPLERIRDISAWGFDS